MVQVRYQYDGSAIILFKQINALLYAISARCTYCGLSIYQGVVHRTLSIIIPAQCTYYAVPIYYGVIHRTLTSLLGGYLLHMRYHVLCCGSRKEYPTFHYCKRRKHIRFFLWRESAVVQLHVMIWLLKIEIWIQIWLIWASFSLKDYEKVYIKVIHIQINYLKQCKFNITIK